MEFTMSINEIIKIVSIAAPIILLALAVISLRGPLNKIAYKISNLESTVDDMSDKIDDDLEEINDTLGSIVCSVSGCDCDDEDDDEDEDDEEDEIDPVTAEYNERKIKTFGELFQFLKDSSNETGTYTFTDLCGNVYNVTYKKITDDVAPGYEFFITRNGIGQELNSNTVDLKILKNDEYFVTVSADYNIKPAQGSAINASKTSKFHLDRSIHPIMAYRDFEYDPLSDLISLYEFVGNALPQLS